MKETSPSGRAQLTAAPRSTRTAWQRNAPIEQELREASLPSVQEWLDSHFCIVARAVAQSTAVARSCTVSARPSLQATTLEPAGAFGAVAFFDAPPSLVPPSPPSPAPPPDSAGPPDSPAGAVVPAPVPAEPPPHPATSSAAQAQRRATEMESRIGAESLISARNYPSAVSFTAGGAAWGRFPHTGQSGSGTTGSRSTSIVRRS